MPGSCLLQTLMYPDGLVNGARGEVVHIVTNGDQKVTLILVKFDHPNVGINAIQCSEFRQRYPTAVPLKKHEAVFLAKGKRGSEMPPPYTRCRVLH